MDPKKPGENGEAPDLSEIDVDGIELPELDQGSAFENGDIRPDGEVSGDLPEEDDDNPFGDSDEALPDDLDEKVLDRDPSKEGSRFDEV